MHGFGCQRSEQTCPCRDAGLAVSKPVPLDERALTNGHSLIWPHGSARLKAVRADHLLANAVPKCSDYWAARLHVEQRVRISFDIAGSTTCSTWPFHTRTRYRRTVIRAHGHTDGHPTGRRFSRASTCFLHCERCDHGGRSCPHDIRTFAIRVTDPTRDALPWRDCRPCRDCAEGPERAGASTSPCARHLVFTARCP